jgi:DNA-binding transcriptional LysR family regulator
LVSLRAFEAVARLKSFRDASEEICVTHAAVSHQVKALETLIGVKLLERTSRSVEMTPAGEQYYPAIREHIQGIVKATRRVQYPDEPDVILFQSYASFNTMWLQPRLADFLQNNPLLVAYVNIEDLLDELERTFAAHPDRTFRVGTGELTDSLGGCWAAWRAASQASMAAWACSAAWPRRNSAK